MSSKAKVILAILASIIVIAIGSLGFVYYFLIGPKLSHQSEETAKFLPHSTQFYFSVNLRPGIRQIRHAINILSVFKQDKLDDEPELDQYPDTLNETLDEFEMETGIDLEKEMFPWIGPEIAIALVDIGNFSPDEIEMVVFLGTTDKLATEDFVKSLVQYLGEEDGLVVYESSIGDSVIYRVSDSQSDFGLSTVEINLVVTDDYLILATSDRVLREVIGRPGISLADNPNFQKARESVQDPRVAMFYFDPGDLGKRLDQFVKENDITSLSPRNFNDDFSFVAGSVSLFDMGIRFTLSTEHSSVTDKTLYKNSLLSADSLPSDTMLLFSFFGLLDGWNNSRGQIDDLLRNYSDILALTGGLYGIDDSLLAEESSNLNLDNILSDIKDQTGIDIEKDILNWMRGEVAIGILPGDFENLSLETITDGGINVLAMFELLESVDKNLSESGLRNIRRFLEDNGLDFDKEQIRNSQAIVAKLGDDLGYSPGYLILEDQVVLGTTRTVFDQVLAVRDKDTDSLAESKLFTKVLKEIDAKPDGIAYINLNQVTKLIEGVLTNLEPAERASFESDVMPFLRPLELMAVVTYRQPAYSASTMLLTFDKDQLNNNKTVNISGKAKMLEATVEARAKEIAKQMVASTAEAVTNGSTAVLNTPVSRKIDSPVAMLPSPVPTRIPVKAPAPARAVTKPTSSAKPPGSTVTREVVKEVTEISPVKKVDNTVFKEFSDESQAFSMRIPWENPPGSYMGWDVVGDYEELTEYIFAENILPVFRAHDPTSGESIIVFLDTNELYNREPQPIDYQQYVEMQVEDIKATLGPTVQIELKEIIIDGIPTAQLRVDRTDAYQVINLLIPDAFDDRAICGSSPIIVIGTASSELLPLLDYSLESFYLIPSYNESIDCLNRKSLSLLQGPYNDFPGTITAVNLLNEFIESPEPVSNKYYLQELSISGFVYSLGYDLEGRPLISLGAEDEFFGINTVACIVPDVRIVQEKGIGDGDKIIVKGIFNNFDGFDVFIEDCKVTDIENPIIPTVIPTPTSTRVPRRLLPTPTPIQPTPTRTATPMPTLLESFAGSSSIGVQIGSLAHQLSWNFTNYSDQTVTVVGVEIRNPNGFIVSTIDREFIDNYWSGGLLSPGDQVFAYTDFKLPPSQEEVMTYEWIWTIKTEFDENIVCKLKISDAISCSFISVIIPTSTATPTVVPTSTVTPTPTVVPTPTVTPTPTVALPTPTATPNNSFVIAFVTDRDGNDEIYSLDAICPDICYTSTVLNLTNNEAGDSEPSWSPNGSRLLFSSTRFQSNSEVYISNSDGTEPINLTNNLAMDTHPSWSPSGSQIAFSSNFDGDYDINVLDSELLCSICSNKRTSLTSNNSADSYPSFSPEGNRILFVNNSAGPLSIFTMDKDGSNKLQLTSNNSNNWDPTWSPDGKKIAFTSTRDGNWEIYIMNPDGSDQVNLTMSNSTNEGNPAWSPDSKKILFSSFRNDNWDIFIMNADGSSQSNVTNHPANDREPSMKYK